MEKGKDFYLNDYQTRLFLFDFAQDGSVIWASSDQFKINKYKNGSSSAILTKKATSLPFPEEKRIELAEKQAKLNETMPVLHMYVPDKYQLIYHLLVGDDGDIWLYVKSKERTGFVRYSTEGIEKGFYTVQGDFDVTKAIVQIFRNKLYFMVWGRKEIKIYKADY